MIEIDIPDFGRLRLAHLVLDYNGTLAFDGRLLSGVADLLERLAEDLRIHIITADTFGSVQQAFAGTDFTVHVLPPGNEVEKKKPHRIGSTAHAVVHLRQVPFGGAPQGGHELERRRRHLAKGRSGDGDHGNQVVQEWPPFSPQKPPSHIA